MTPTAPWHQLVKRKDVFFTRDALAVGDRCRVRPDGRGYDDRRQHGLQGRRDDEHRLALGLGRVIPAHVSVVVDFLSIGFEARGKSHGILPLVSGARLITPLRAARDRIRCDCVRHLGRELFDLCVRRMEVTFLP